MRSVCYVSHKLKNETKKKMAVFTGKYIEKLNLSMMTMIRSIYTTPSPTPKIESESISVLKMLPPVPPVNPTTTPEEGSLRPISVRRPDSRGVVVKEFVREKKTL
mmetsp:Transcript_31051/g.42460  ORF Transcript_31051/g.42460 Transcript_31051/m.42460 type:complete len:105 (+) Transcript_31051:161-475(+)